MTSFHYNKSDSLMSNKHSESETPISERKLSPDLIRRGNQSIPYRPESFNTSIFHSNPRQRASETIFSFDMGPNFSGTKQLYELCNMEQTNSYKVQIHSKLDRGFFKAEQNWTCYRRNYFQVSATFDIHGNQYPIQVPETPCWLIRNNEKVLVDFFSIGIHACIADYDKPIELVQHTPKRDKGPQVVPQPVPVRAGGNLNSITLGTNQNIVTFERLQFKTATANNGKRRTSQQFYEIVIDLFANIHNQAVTVATSSSVPLVVRGRSPGHYADSHIRFKTPEHTISLNRSPPLYSPYSYSQYSPTPHLYMPSPSSSTYFSSAHQVYDNTFVREKPDKQTNWSHLSYPYENQGDFPVTNDAGRL